MFDQPATDLTLGGGHVYVGGSKNKVKAKDAGGKSGSAVLSLSDDVRQRLEDEAVRDQQLISEMAQVLGSEEESGWSRMQSKKERRRRRRGQKAEGDEDQTQQAKNTTLPATGQSPPRNGSSTETTPAPSPSPHDTQDHLHKPHHTHTNGSSNNNNTHRSNTSSTADDSSSTTSSTVGGGGGGGHHLARKGIVAPSSTTTATLQPQAADLAMANEGYSLMSLLSQQDPMGKKERPKKRNNAAQQRVGTTTTTPPPVKSKEEEEEEAILASLEQKLQAKAQKLDATVANVNEAHRQSENRKRIQERESRRHSEWNSRQTKRD